MCDRFVFELRKIAPRSAGVFFLILCISLAASALSGGGSVKRAITVEDSVSMAMVTSPADSDEGAPHPYFSPDGRRFVLLIRSVNIKDDTNDASLVLFKSEDALSQPKPERLVKMSSSAYDRYAIRQLRWLDDNKTLVFLGDHPGEPSQVYALDIAARRLRQLTHHPTTITNYDITGDGAALAYVAEPHDEWPSPKGEGPAREVVISGQNLENLIAGHHFEPASLEVYCEKKNSAARAVAVAAEYFVPETRMTWSPGGRYLVFPAWLRGLASHPGWSAYRDPFIEQVFSTPAYKQRFSMLQQYLVFDTVTGSLRPLLNAPVLATFDRFAWANDGGSLYMSTYLPLDGGDPAEREAREQNKFLTQILLPGLEYRKVKAEDFPPEQLKKDPLSVTVEQDLNTPPRIYASDPQTGQKALLLDLNPQFQGLDFGRVEKIEWNVDGYPTFGALYFPPDFTAGKRYPLVIQTHGLEPGQFSMDGRSEWSSGFAARPLAATGMLVLQTWRFKDPRDYDRLAQDRDLGGTAEEARLRFEPLVYERAIDSLDEKGLIDRERVGVVGFSRTSCHAGYALTHSHYHFAAAMLIDGVSCSYFEEIALPDEARDMNFVNGGASPFGAGIWGWLQNAPGFNLDKVHTPVELLSINDYSAVSAWEWYVGLSLQNKPVDFVVLPEGNHIGIRPSQRMLTEQAVVDWFAFWLKGETNPDLSKADQNARWQELKQRRAEPVP
jgi:dipeptidyl aminopeptidase/acylaminoacyl peptidase